MRLLHLGLDGRDEIESKRSSCATLRRAIVLLRLERTVLQVEGRLRDIAQNVRLVFAAVLRMLVPRPHLETWRNGAILGLE